MSQTAPPEFIGYHGCNSAVVESIKTQNFILPQRDDLWFGKAAYFFAECTVYHSDEHAKLWAIKAAKIKGDHRLKYPEYAVLKVVITPANLLDMTKDLGKEMFQRTLDALRSRRLPIKGEWEDQIVIDFMISEFDFDVLITDVYSRFEYEIVNNVRSNVPNCRIISVYKPQTSIDTSKIVVLSTGPVPPTL